MRKVIIMRGPSGSGKSTYVQNNFPDAYVCSADKYFEKSGEYKFNPKAIPAAHGWCQRNFKDALQRQEPLVVVDNTNTRRWEVKPYVEMARKYGYAVEYVRLKTPEHIAARRNVHNVPPEAVKQMYNRFQDIPGEKIVSGAADDNNK